MKKDQLIREVFAHPDAQAVPDDLSTAAEAWSRLQFRLAYRPRRDKFTLRTGTLLAALYVLAFLIWVSWSGWMSAGLLVVVAAAATAAIFLLRHASRSFGN